MDLNGVNDYIKSVNAKMKQYLGYDLFPTLKTLDRINSYVYETENYDKFTPWDKNRNISKKDVNIRKKSLLEHGMLMPAIVNGENEIGEGNHRFEALKELAKEGHPPIPMRYIIDENLTVEQLRVMNNLIKLWGTNGFTQHLTNSGSQDFKRLKSLEEKYDLKESDAFNILLYTDFVSGTDKTTIFETGSISMKEVEWNIFENFLAHVNELKEYFNIKKSDYHAIWPITQAKSYKNEKMISKGKYQFEKRNNVKLNISGSSLKEKEAWLLDFYNRNLQENNKITKNIQGRKTIYI